MQNIDTEKIILLREFFENVSDISISKYIFCVYLDSYLEEFLYCHSGYLF